MNIKKTKIMYRRNTTLTQTMKMPKLLKVLFTLVQSSVQMETAAKKSREG